MPRSDLIRDTLAVYRLTRLVTEDEITRPLRERVARRWPDSKLAYFVTCPYCVSVWAGLVVSSGIVPRRVRWALTLSGATALIEDQNDRLGAVVASVQRR